MEKGRLGDAATSDGDGWQWQFSFACDELSPRVQMQFGNSEERRGEGERSISKAAGSLAVTGLRYLFKMSETLHYLDFLFLDIKCLIFLNSDDTARVLRQG